jgi:ribosomal biogenesis protein LAS1
MFRHAKPVAWRDWNEWRDTYNMLYSSNTKEILQGCARVSAWSAKQSLPIAVEITASLQRELHGPPNVLAISLAVIRFINGVVEPFKNANLSVPISTIGASYGVPDFIVGIRHSATHGRMPTFELAALGAEKALSWLKTNYWEAQIAELDSLETTFREDLLQCFLHGRDPFANVHPNLFCCFGISALLKLALNPNQSRATVSSAFQERVAEFLSQVKRKYQYFPSAFVMEIAGEVSKGNQIAAVWLDFFLDKGLVDLEGVARMFRWADPEALGRAMPEKVVGAIARETVGTGKPEMEWPAASIGSLPVGSQCLTMTEDEWEFAVPIGEEAEVEDVPVEVERPVEPLKEREREDLLEIW